MANEGSTGPSLTDDWENGLSLCLANVANLSPEFTCLTPRDCLPLLFQEVRRLAGTMHAGIRMADCQSCQCPYWQHLSRTTGHSRTRAFCFLIHTYGSCLWINDVYLHELISLINPSLSLCFQPFSLAFSVIILSILDGNLLLFLLSHMYTDAGVSINLGTRCCVSMGKNCPYANVPFDKTGCKSCFAETDFFFF